MFKLNKITVSLEKIGGVFSLKEWLLGQFETLNILNIIIIFLFVTLMSKANTQKLLKEQSQELYNELEELKDEIRGNAQAYRK